MGNKVLYDSQKYAIKEYENLCIIDGKIQKKEYDYIEKNLRFIITISINKCKQTCIYQTELFSLQKNNQKILISSSQKVRCVETNELVMDKIRIDLNVANEEENFILLIHRNKNVFPVSFSFYDIITNKINNILISSKEPENYTVNAKCEKTSINFKFQIIFSITPDLTKEKNNFYYYILNNDNIIYKSKTITNNYSCKSVETEEGQVPIEFLGPSFELHFKRVGYEQPFYKRKFTIEEFFRNNKNSNQDSDEEYYEDVLEEFIKFSTKRTIKLVNLSKRSMLLCDYQGSQTLLNHYNEVHQEFIKINEKKYFRDINEESSNQILLDKDNQNLKGAVEEPKEKINLKISINSVEKNNKYILNSYQYIKGKKEFLQTDTVEVKDENNITFPTSLILDYYFEKEQKLEFEIKKNNNSKNYNIKTTMGCIVGSKNSTFKKILESSREETFLIKAEKFQNASTQILEINFSMKNELNLVIDKNLFFYKITTKDNQLLYQSNIIRFGTSNVKIPCYLINGPIKFIFVNNKLQEFYSYETDLESMKNICTFKIYFNPDMYYTIILNNKIHNIPTFLDYLKAGVRISLTIAIDFSESNGDPHEETSYHCLDINSLKMSINNVISSADLEKSYSINNVKQTINLNDIKNNIDLNNNLNKSNNYNINNNYNNNQYNLDLPSLNQINQNQSVDLQNNNCLIDGNNNNNEEANNNNNDEEKLIGNDYERAIKACGDIVAFYDNERLFPVYGFNAEVESMSNLNQKCFPINFRNDNPKIYEIKGVLKTYRECLNKIKLLEPTKLAPVFQEIFSNKNIDKNNILDYKILMILTDGLIDDIEETIEEIQKCVKLPVSIIIIGIGYANFQNMEILDDDIETDRDIVKFVPFNKYKDNPSLLASQVLEEIPKQIVGFYKQMKKTPENINEKKNE